MDCSFLRCHFHIRCCRQMKSKTKKCGDDEERSDAEEMRSFCEFVWVTFSKGCVFAARTSDNTIDTRFHGFTWLSFIVTPEIECTCTEIRSTITFHTFTKCHRTVFFSAILLCSIDKCTFYPRSVCPMLVVVDAFFVRTILFVVFPFLFIPLVHCSSQGLHCKRYAITINVLCDKTPEMVFSQVNDERQSASAHSFELCCGMANGGGNTPITVLSTYFLFDIYWWRTRASRSHHFTRWHMDFEFSILIFVVVRARVCLWVLVPFLAFSWFLFFVSFTFTFLLCLHIHWALTCLVAWHIYSSNWFDWTERQWILQSVLCQRTSPVYYMRFSFCNFYKLRRCDSEMAIFKLTTHDIQGRSGRTKLTRKRRTKLKFVLTGACRGFQNGRFYFIPFYLLLLWWYRSPVQTELIKMEKCASENPFHLLAKTTTAAAAAQTET